ncbi:unnamed protein product [Bathycoccus prasinos]
MIADSAKWEHEYGLSEIEFSVQMRRTLTGAVASQRVTEVCEGKLNERRKLSVERNGKSLPDCESDTSSRDESRP